MGVASWLLCGPDLSIVLRRTPFTADDAKDLWQYYDSLPLDRRPEIFVIFLVAIEVLQMGGILTRADFPKLRRALDAYTVALGATCLAPRRVFYRLHQMFW